MTHAATGMDLPADSPHPGGRPLDTALARAGQIALLIGLLVLAGVLL